MGYMANEKFTFELNAATFESWQELTGHADRAVGVLGGALIEESLDNALTADWRAEEKKGSKPTAREQLDASGNFTFSMKIDLAYLTHFIGPLVRNDLHNIRHIRNRFAHRTCAVESHIWEPVTFEMDEIKSRCENIQLINMVIAHAAGKLIKTDTPRGRFLAAIGIYTYLFFARMSYPNELAVRQTLSIGLS
jgi:hypothetical protein